MLLVTSPATADAQDGTGVGLPGFERSPHFDEQILDLTIEPEVSVHINAPRATRLDPGKPTRLVLYALPNGNTIAQTIGKQRREGVDWHFFIQHIGAQTRRLREVIKDENLVVAYLEAGGRSWPRWRQQHADSGQRIAEVIETLRARVPGNPTTVELASHSGGGSLIFGYINRVEAIPGWIERIVFLDSNYGYSDEQGHTGKLIAWLKRSPRHHLGVIAYDDRRVSVNGKLVVGPTGGTYRKTHRMLEHLGASVAFAEESTEQYSRHRALEGRIDIIVLNNPDNVILHTVMVEKNGFMHGLTFATRYEGQAGRFYGPATYERWIQPE